MTSSGGKQRPPAVWAVVVTYGARGALCHRAAESALEAGVAKVVIVDNGADPEARADWGKWAEQQSKVTIVSLGRNAGSACGFGRGLQKALADGAEYVWLLDDDSDVQPGALDELVHEAQRRLAAGVWRFALVSLRPDRPLMRSLADGGSIDETFPSRSSFLNFNLRDLRRLRRRLSRPTPPLGQGPQLVSGLPYAPYGGLFLPRHLAEVIGVPDERLVVYADDTEFTSRVSRMGGDIVLVTRSRILDQMPSWYVTSPGRGAEPFVTAGSNARVYYSVRNLVYFETSCWCGSAALYQINKAVVLTLIMAAALKHRRLRRLKLILAAVRDGERRVLGQTLDLGDNM